METNPESTPPPTNSLYSPNPLKREEPPKDREEPSPSSPTNGLHECPTLADGKCPSDNVVRNFYDASVDLPLRDLTAEIDKAGEWHRASGGFADVHVAFWRHGEKRIKVAVKVIKIPTRQDGNEVTEKRLRRELLVCLRLQHRNILPLLGITYGFSPPGSYGMVCPWVNNGDLSCYLETHKMIPLSERILMLRQIANALCYLHSNSVVHGDLTGNNILVTNDGRMLLCDFGLSAIKEDYSNPMYHTSSTPKYNLPWTAPEIVLSESLPRPNKTTDIYSFGSVTFQVLAGVRPYHGMANGPVYISLHAGRFPPRPHGGSISEDFWQFMVRCWDRTPEKRPVVAEVHSVLAVHLMLASSVWTPVGSQWM